MTKMEKEELASRIEAMSTDELELVLEHIPAPLCLDRVQKEFVYQQTFLAELKNVFETKKARLDVENGIGI